MNNDDLLKRIEKLFARERTQTKKLIQEATEPISSKLDKQEKKVDILLKEAEHVRTIIETLMNKIDETKAEIDEIRLRQRPRHAD